MPENMQKKLEQEREAVALPPSKEKRTQGNFYLSIGIIVLALLLLFVLIPTQSTSYVTSTGFGARTFPRFIGYGLIVLSLLAMVVHFRSPEEQRKDLAKISVHELMTILPVIAILIISSIGMEYIGFYLSYGLGLAVTMLFLGDRSIKNMVLSVAFFLVFCYVILELCLQFRLPIGLLFK